MRFYFLKCITKAQQGWEDGGGGGGGGSGRWGGGCCEGEGGVQINCLGNNND